MILSREHRILREKAADVGAADFGSAKLKKIIAAMSKALAKEDDGVALAAPQIGESIRLFIVSGNLFKKDDSKKRPEDLVFINPKIIKRSRKKELMEEGCLSVRPLYGKVHRNEKVRVRAYDEKGKPFEWSGSGLMSQIFQHEIDHLNGMLFVDRALETWEMPPAKAKEKVSG